MNLLNRAGKRRSAFASIGVFAATALLLAGCGSMADIFDGTKFSESSMGVGASPRVTSSKNVPKGGGRYQVGQPYTVAGRTFVPREQPNLNEIGQASWYGPAFHGRLTANGEVFDQYHLSGAHPTLPLPSYVRVTNLANGQSAIVRINDRGPFAHGRVIDLSRRTAEVLGFINDGMTDVQVQYVGPAPLNGDDTRFLVASINQMTPFEANGGTQMAYQGSQVASAEVETAVEAAGAAAVQPAADLPFQLLSYGGEIDAVAPLAEPTGTPVRIPLGVFDSARAEEIATRFAILGAVDSTMIAQGDGIVTHLMLTHLREGVSEQDALDLGHSLGLTPSVLY